MDALQAHLEFLFSDANLARDRFLRGQLTTTGRIPLRTLLTFPKVAQLSREAAAQSVAVSADCDAGAAGADGAGGAERPTGIDATAAAPAAPSPSVALATAAARARGLIFSFAPDTPATEGALAPARAWEARAPGAADARTVYFETLPAVASTLDAVESLRRAISDYFSRFGAVLHVSLPRWRAATAQARKTGSSPLSHAARVAERGPLMGFGFVEFSADAAAAAAVAAHRGVSGAIVAGSSNFDGRALRVLAHSTWTAFKQIATAERAASRAPSGSVGNESGARGDAIPAGVHIRIDGLHPKLPYASLWALVSAAVRPAFLHAPEIFGNGVRPPDAVRSGVARGWARRASVAAWRAARSAAAARAGDASGGGGGDDDDAGAGGAAMLVSATVRYRTSSDAEAALSFLTRGPRPPQLAGSLIAARILRGSEDDEARSAACAAVLAAGAVRAAERAAAVATTTASVGRGGGVSRGGDRSGGAQRGGAGSATGGGKRAREGEGGGLSSSGGGAVPRTGGGADGGYDGGGGRVAPRVKRRRAVAE